MIVMFFVTSFISIPPSIQDMAIHMGTTAVSGYTALVHVRLYKIYPVLVVVPTVILAAIVHFWVQGNKFKAKVEYAKIFGQSELKQSNTVEQEKITNKMSSVNDTQTVSNHHVNRRQSVVNGIQIAMNAADALSVEEKSTDIDFDEDSNLVSSATSVQDENMVLVSSIMDNALCLPEVQSVPITLPMNDIEAFQRVSVDNISLHETLFDDECYEEDLDIELSSDSSDSSGDSADLISTSSRSYNFSESDEFSSLALSQEQSKGNDETNLHERSLTNGVMSTVSSDYVLSSTDSEEAL
jgi:hypothetical protein